MENLHTYSHDPHLMHIINKKVGLDNWLVFCYFILKIEGCHASANAHELVDNLASFPLDRERISQPGFEPPTSSLRFGYMSTII